ncbi:hypothetical protein LTR28_007413 [Elasticomyces elasticus]|nr:hypothetical protein LTR28_007413 [Elasticomyces elasticus]
MWRTLSAVSSGRSLVLTTHSMEEADALADRAGIMAKRMLALGTSDSLRRKHGDSYYVHLVHKDAPFTQAEEMSRIKTWIEQHIPGAVTENRVFHGQLRFSVPNRSNLATSSPKTFQDDLATTTDRNPFDKPTTTRTPRTTGISALFALLEAHKRALGFQYYSVSQATLDQVFLSIVGKHNVEEENYARRNARKVGAWERIGGAVVRAYRNA